TGRANFYGGLTTAVALGSLIVSDFRAFYEFGIISLGGIALILLAFATVMPSLVVLLEHRGTKLREPASAVWTRTMLPGLERPSRRRKIWAAVLVGLITLIAIVGLPRIEFVRTLDALELRTASAWELDDVVEEVIDGSQTPAVIPTDSPEHSREVVEELRERRDEHDGGYTIERIASLNTVLPEEQEEKIELLTELRDDLADLPSDSRDEELEDYLDEIEGVLEVAPLTADELPVSIREPFERKDDRGDLVLAFPSFTLGDTARITDFVDVLDELPGVDADGRYDAISDEMLLYDIVRLVETDAVWMLVITLTGLLIISLIAFRRRRDTILQLATLGAAFLAAIGLTALADVEFNFMNIVILPIWLGLGIDASFHVLMHLRKHPRDRGAHLSTALAIGGAFLTSMIGFGAMLLADHQGLYSLGQIAVIGLAAILTVNLLIQLLLVESVDNEEAEDKGEEPEALP
ncbi:MAG: MMPL family transporter, partial [Persicimonas sp.]